MIHRPPWVLLLADDRVRVRPGPGEGGAAHAGGGIFSPNDVGNMLGNQSDGDWKESELD